MGLVSNKIKYDFICSLLSEGDSMVCLDARQQGVSVPREHRNNPSLNLILNLGFRRPIEVQEEVICATLAFSGRPHKCVVPMEAIWAAYDPNSGRGQVWAESAPKEVLDKLEEAAKAPGPKPASSPKLVSLPCLKKEADPDAQKKPPKPEKRKSHLRIVK